MRIPGVYEPSLTRQSTLGASRSNNLRLGYRVQRIPQQTEMSPDRFHSRSKGHFGSFSPTVAVNPDTPSPLGSRQLTGHDTELLCSLGSVASDRTDRPVGRPRSPGPLGGAISGPVSPLQKGSSRLPLLSSALLGVDKLLIRPATERPGGATAVSDISRQKTQMVRVFSGHDTAADAYPGNLSEAPLILTECSALLLRVRKPPAPQNLSQCW